MSPPPKGRVTRRLDPDPVWARLAARSLDGHEALERESGVGFHCPVGFLAVAGDDQGGYASKCRETAASGATAGLLAEGAVEELSGVAAMLGRLPGGVLDGLGRLPGRLGPKSCGLLEPPARPKRRPVEAAAAEGAVEEKGAATGGGLQTTGQPTGAGYLSARRLLLAQLRAGALAGAVRFDEPAAAVLPAAAVVPGAREGAGVGGGEGKGVGGGEGKGVGGGEGEDLCVRLALSGRLLTARRAVLVCTNASTNLFPLLPGPPLALRLDTQTTVSQRAVCDGATAVVSRGGRPHATLPTVEGGWRLEHVAPWAFFLCPAFGGVLLCCKVRLVLRSEDAGTLAGMPSMVIKFDGDDPSAKAEAKATAKPAAKAAAASEAAKAPGTGTAAEAGGVGAAEEAAAATAAFWSMDSAYVLPPILYAAEGPAIKAGHGKVREHLPG
jgi:hypothetical protein